MHFYARFLRKRKRMILMNWMWKYMVYTIKNSNLNFSKISDISPSSCILSPHPIDILFSISTAFLSKLFLNRVMINFSNKQKCSKNRFD